MTEPGLTRCEATVLDLVTRGLSSKEIAARLEISVHTVKKYRDALNKKLGARNAVQLTLRAIDLKLIGMK